MTFKKLKNYIGCITHYNYYVQLSLYTLLSKHTSMSLSSILLWEAVKEYGYNVRKENLDGLEAWNKLKVLLAPCSVSFNWNQDCMTFYNHLISVGVMENYIEENMTKVQWEQDHFLLQHGRIPFKNANSADLSRLFQVAYNAGQFRAEVEKGSYRDTLVEYYESNRLGKIDTYFAKFEDLQVSYELVRSVCELID